MLSARLIGARNFYCMLGSIHSRPVNVFECVCTWRESKAEGGCHRQKRGPRGQSGHTAKVSPVGGPGTMGRSSFVRVVLYLNLFCERVRYCSVGRMFRVELAG